MGVTRRDFLLAALAAARLRAQRPVAEPLFDRGFARVTRIAEGVYATIADPSKGAQCGSNGGVIAGRDAVLIVEGHMQPLPFDKMINPETGRMKPRKVDVRGEGYECARRYMIRLEKTDFEDPQLAKLAATVNMTPEQFQARFGYVAGVE